MNLAELSMLIAILYREKYLNGRANKQYSTLDTDQYTKMTGQTSIFDVVLIVSVSFERQMKHKISIQLLPQSLRVRILIYRGYYTVARRYEFYIRVART